VSGKVTVRPPVEGGVPAGPPGTSKLMSSAVRVITWRTSFAVSGEVSVCASTASRPADTMRPAIPELRPVASDEHEVAETDTERFPPKLVQPFRKSHEFGSVGTPKSAIAFTMMVWTYGPGKIWCQESSSAADAMTGRPCA